MSITDVEADRGRDFVQSLERGLHAIRCFTGDRPDLSITDVAERTQISRAAARRILLTLEGLGYVGRNQAGLFHLQPAVLSLGYAYISGQQLPQVARPYMQSVADEIHGSSSLAVLDRSDILFVGRVRSPSLLTTTLSVGSRLPAHITAMGRVLLAEVPDDQIDRYLQNANFQSLTDLTLVDPADVKAAILKARQLKYSFVDGELAIGVRAVAVPVHDHSGAVVASLNVSVADARASREQIIETCLPVLRRAAAAITAGLGPS